jgi:hypothetical protein
MSQWGHQLLDGMKIAACVTWLVGFGYVYGDYPALVWAFKAAPAG